MASYAYTARTKTGEKASGTINASDKRGATLAVERMGYVPISIKEGAAAAKADKKGKNGKNGKAGKNGKSGKNGKASKQGASSKKHAKTDAAADSSGKKMKLNELLEFTREIKDLVTSGMTLGQALDSLERREGGSPAQKRILSELREDIINGKSLSAALMRHPKTFSSFYTNMVKAGEASGQLPRALDHIITHNERIRAARENVTGAMIYPLVVLALGFLAVIFLMAFVIPSFSRVFEDMNMALPGPTRMLIGLSNFVVSIWGLVALALVIIFGFMLKGWTKTEKGRYAFDKFLLRMPVIKNIMANNAFAQFARTLGGLMENGVPVLTAMQITGDASGNSVISSELHRAKDRVADGATISGTLSEGGVFPSLLTDMLSVGERSGNVPRSLNHIADRYDADLTRSISTFSKLIEPILLLLIAGFVGFVAIAMLMAVFQLSNGLEGF